MERVSLESGAELIHADQPYSYVYFPVDAVLSLTLATEEGHAIEVSMEGPEGVAGAWFRLASDSAPWSCIAQVPGDVWQLPAHPLEERISSLPVFHALLERHALTQTFLISMSVLCHRFHELTPRMARWLLILSTKTNLNPIPITHEFLGQMLGAHRPSVTLALQSLARDGLIANDARGQVRLLDELGLRAAACECFERVQAFNGRVRTK